MEQTKYDVFISYSRKDYVDEQKNVIPGNIVSQIKTSLDENGISYWMDEKGIYSGDEYARLIASYIRRCAIFLFVSTENSNISEWTSDEIATARMYKKKIIPFKYDDSFYNETVILFIAKLDYIDYFVNPDHAFTKLIDSIKKVLDEIEEAKRREEELKQQKQREEEERKRKEEEKVKKEAIRKEIRTQAEDCQRLIIQQETIVKQLVNKNIFIGNEYKQCPICTNKVSLNRRFCEKCGWQFPLLYSLDGNESFVCDDEQLSVARSNWQGITRVIELQNRNKELEGIKKVLENTNKDYEQKMCYQEKSLKDLSDQCSRLKESIDEKVRELASLEKNVKTTSMQLEFCKQEASKNEEQKKSNEVLISKLQKEIVFLKETIDKYEQEIRIKEGQSQELRKFYEVLQDKYNQVLKSTSDTAVSGGVKKTGTTNRTTSVQKTTGIQNKSKTIKSHDEAFSIIETCCDRNPIQDDFDLNKAKLSLSRLKSVLDKKYDLYVSKSAIIACKNIGELKLLLYNSSNKIKNQ